jgi:hypothetical protein
MSLTAHPIDSTDQHSHFVQLYDADERVLVENVGKFLSDGLHLGGGLAIVSTADHRGAYLSELKARGWRPDELARDGRLDILDAAETLAGFMIDGHPNAERFDRIVGTAVRSAVGRAGDPGLRAYGDMVGLLWMNRQYPAAIRLEQLWNKLRTQVPFSLMCGYPVDVFGEQFDPGVLDAMLCAHTHLLPAGKNGDLEHAVNRAMLEVLGTDEMLARQTTGQFRNVWAKIPTPEATILWLRKHMPDKADQVLARAREYYKAS